MSPTINALINNLLMAMPLAQAQEPSSQVQGDALTMGWFVVILVAYVLVAAVLAHAALCFFGGLATDIEEANGCAECCFSGNRCNCSYWRWHPFGIIMRINRPLSRLCPFSFERTTPRKTAIRAIASGYKRKVPFALFGLIGAIATFVIAVLRSCVLEI